MTVATMIDDLLRAGLSQQVIARRAGLSQSMVSLLHHRQRRDIAYGRAAQLVALHREIVRERKLTT